MRKIISFGLFVLLGALFFYFFLYKSDLGKVWIHVKEARWGLLALGVLANLLSVMVRVWRWRVFLTPAKKDISWKTLTVATFGGYFISTVLPGRLGEVIRPLYAAAREGLSRITCITTAVVERFLDIGMLLVLFGTYLWFYRPDTTAYSLKMLVRLAAFGMAGAFVLFVALFILATSGGRIWMPGRLRPHFESFRAGLQSLRGFRTAGTLVGLTALIWGLIAVNTWCVLGAFHLHLPWMTPFMLMAVSAVGFLIPTPGGVGGVHKAFQIGLVVFHGVDYNVATAVALVGHLLAMGPLALVGMAAFGFSGIPLREMLLLAKKPEGAPGEAGTAEQP
jgi:glycosyltransferase 2 family protein